MPRNIFILALILSAILEIYFLKGNNYFFLIVSLDIMILEIFRLSYMKLNVSEILLTLILGPLTFLLGRQSDYWWKMWQKDPVNFSR